MFCHLLIRSQKILSSNSKQFCRFWLQLSISISTFYTEKGSISILRFLCFERSVYFLGNICSGCFWRPALAALRAFKWGKYLKFWIIVFWISDICITITLTLYRKGLSFSYCCLQLAIYYWICFYIIFSLLKSKSWFWFF